jgi:hypothetical protein
MNPPLGPAWSRRSGLLAGALVVVSVAPFVFALWLTGTYVDVEAAIEFAVDAIVILPFVLVGGILLWKRPTSVVSWLLVGCGAGIALTSAVHAYADVSLVGLGGNLPTDPRVVLVANPVSTVALAFGLVLLPLLFPDGSPVSPRWRRVVRVATAAMVLSVLTGPFAESDLRVFTEGEAVALGANPFATWPGAGLLRATAGVAFVTLLLLVPAAFASLVLRYVRGTLAERLQIRWVVVAVGVFVTVFVCLQGSELLFGLVLPELLWDVLLSFSIALLPVAICIAILRYHLYEIDRVLSRAVSYLLLTVVLVGVYAAGILGLGAVARAMTAGSGDLVVASSTLAVAVLFNPLRRRLQSTVDRRFNRARYDARGAIEDFAKQTRDEVDLASLDTALRATVVTNLQPAGVSLWLRTLPEVAQ